MVGCYSADDVRLGNIKIHALKPYAWRYEIRGKIVKSGFSKGRDMVNLTQFKHGDVEKMKDFLFNPLFSDNY